MVMPRCVGTVRRGVGRVPRPRRVTASPIVDGVPFSPATAEEMQLLPGAAEAVGLLHEAGALVFVVTNQPDVARGHSTPPSRTHAQGAA